jgi:hypothetical protein
MDSVHRWIKMILFGERDLEPCPVEMKEMQQWQPSEVQDE